MTVRTVCHAWIGLAALFGAGCAPAPDEPVPTPTEPEEIGLPAGDAWPGFGGPGGNFRVEVEGLAESWPADGPPELWSRPLGEGYAAVSAADGVLYTGYRDDDDDVIVALSTADGATVWESRYSAPLRSGNVSQFGTGPNATPLVLEDRVITLSFSGLLHCFDRSDGTVLWEHDLVGDFGGEVLDFGYAASPVYHDGLVLVLAGGKQGVLALRPGDGSVAWKSKRSTVSYATPVVIAVEGQQQIVYLTADEIIGLDADGGDFLWSFPVVNQYRNNATGPHWGDDGLLFVATQLDGGTRALRLARDGDATTVEEVWSSNKMSVHFWNTLRLGDHVYASVGGNASILAGIDVTDGRILWRERGFEQVNFVHAGELAIMLDGNGHLALARLSPEGIDVLSQYRMSEGPTWTAPTLVGTTLYVRDKQTIRALDLGEGR